MNKTSANNNKKTSPKQQQNLERRSHVIQFIPLHSRFDEEIVQRGRQARCRDGQLVPLVALRELHQCSHHLAKAVRDGDRMEVARCGRTVLLFVEH